MDANALHTVLGVVPDPDDAGIRTIVVPPRDMTEGDPEPFYRPVRIGRPAILPGDCLIVRKAPVRADHAKGRLCLIDDVCHGFAVGWCVEEVDEHKGPDGHRKPYLYHTPDPWNADAEGMVLDETESVWLIEGVVLNLSTTRVGEGPNCRAETERHLAERPAAEAVPAAASV